MIIETVAALLGKSVFGPARDESPRQAVPSASLGGNLPNTPDFAGAKASECGVFGANGMLLPVIVLQSLLLACLRMGFDG